MNIGLNITKNDQKYNHFLKMIKSGTHHHDCNFINVSLEKNLKQHMPNLDALLTYDLSPDTFSFANKQLKWIHFGVAGVEKSLFPQILKSKTILTNCSGIHTRPVSEFIMASILYYCKRFDQCQTFKSTQEWKQWEVARTMVQLKNKTLGIIGYGAIGKATAKMAKQFGMNIIATRRLQKKIAQNTIVDQLLPLSDIESLYKQSDFIAITCPLTPLTRNMVSKQEFKWMKSDAYIINIARGAIIDEKALISAVKNQEIAGAALDVFNTEPLPKGHPYFNLDNVFLSPHISGNFPEYQTDMIEQFIDQLNRFLDGKALKNRICKKRLY